MVILCLFLLTFWELGCMGSHKHVLWDFFLNKQFHSFIVDSEGLAQMTWNQMECSANASTWGVTSVMQGG